MRPDHSTPGELHPASASASAAHAHSSRSISQSPAVAASSSASRRMGSSGRAHGGGEGDRAASRPMRVVDVPELVLKLCKNILKKEREEDPVLRNWHHALRILNARTAERAEGDEHNMSQKIQRRLVQIERVEDAANFARLHRRLQGQPNIRRPGAVIDFLWSISEFNPSGHKVPLNFPPASSIYLPSPFASSTPTCSVMKGGMRPYAGPWGDGSTPQLLHSSGPTQSSGISSIHPSAGWSGQSTRHGSSTLPTPHQHPSLTSKSHSRTAGVSLSGRGGPVPPLSETALVREVIYSLQGIDGSFLKFDKASDSWIVVDEPNIGTINKSKRLYMLRFAELGWLHNKIRQFVEGKGSERAYGLVGQSYLAALNQELTEYYRLVGVLESKLHQDEEAISKDEHSPEALTLRRLQVWLAEPMDRLKFVACLVDNCKGLKGGALASSVAAHMQHGDPYLRVIVENILCWVALPIHAQLIAWIFDGELDDTFHEFFVASDPQVVPERLWHDKYTLRRAMIPAFLSLEQANNILSTGKSINFLRQLCQDQAITDGSITGAIPGCPPRPTIAADIDGVPGKSASMQPIKCMFEGDVTGQFQKLIDSSYTSTNKYLLEVLHTRYQFMDHLMGMRRYLLLGQGDFIRHLMDLLAEDLEKPANLLYMHNLTGTLETAIRATNAQYDNQEILKRLDARLLQVSTGDAGWDVFCLAYKVDSPISTVFTEESLVIYLRVFNFLWRVKRMEYILSNIWINQMADSRKLLRSRGPVLSEMSYIIHLSQVVTTEMVHFIGQLQYYITFEVLECSWDALLKKVKSAGDMDQLINAHQEFLNTIIKRSLLDDKSNNILNQLRTLLDHIIKFQILQNEMFSKGLEEQERRARIQGKKQLRSQEGQWGGGDEEEHAEQARRQAFHKNVVSDFKRRLMILYQTYQDMMNKFLLMLNSHSDENLKFLSFRLDFNEFYKSKEPKIRTSLCFRQSVSSPTHPPPATAAAAAASVQSRLAPPPLRPQQQQSQQPQQQQSTSAAAHHASMDKINGTQTEKRQRGLSSL